jgi:hypothetical protein
MGKPYKAESLWAKMKKIHETELLWITGLFVATSPRLGKFLRILIMIFFVGAMLAGFGQGEVFVIIGLIGVVLVDISIQLADIRWRIKNKWTPDEK